MKFDELLKSGRINNFLKTEFNSKNELSKMEFKKEKEELCQFNEKENIKKNDYDKDNENLKNKENEESLIFEIELDSLTIKKNKDIVFNTNNKLKELKPVRKDSYTFELELEDLIYELNKIKNSPEKSNSLSSNTTQNLENQKEILDSLNFDNDNKIKENFSKII